MTDILMPRLSDTMEEGVILGEIETDKTTMDFEAYDSGVVSSLLVEEGSTVAIGERVAVLGDDSTESDGSTDSGGAEDSGESDESEKTEDSGESAAGDDSGGEESEAGDGEDRDESADSAGASEASGEEESSEAEAPSQESEESDEDGSGIRISPLARKMADKHDIDTAEVEGTGPRGRIIRVDVEKAMLREHPEVNSSWNEDSIIRRGAVNVGIAVALDSGLIVPVIRDADRKSVSQIGRESRDLAERAKTGKLHPDEFSGGSFSIGNLGMYGIDDFTAIINPPEAAILAVGAAVDEPVVRDGELTTRTVITMTMTVDHRVLNGAEAAVILGELKALLEEPLRVVV